MALILPSLADIRGSLGGLTAQRTRTGVRIARRVYPLSCVSDRQDRRRYTLSKYGKRWDKLSASVRKRWELDAARNPIVDEFGNVMERSPRQWYALCWLNALASAGEFEFFGPDGPTPSYPFVPIRGTYAGGNIIVFSTLVGLSVPDFWPVLARERAPGRPTYAKVLYDAPIKYEFAGEDYFGFLPLDPVIDSTPRRMLLKIFDRFGREVLRQSYPAL